MNIIPIVFENNEIIIINKPAGISVQGGEGVAHPLDEELSKQMGYKIHLVHRLDKETCGLMVVAKNPAAAAKWINYIAGGNVKKEYVAITFGLPQINGREKKQGTIQDSVTKGKRELAAVTHFSVEKSWTLEISGQDESNESKSITFSKIHLELGTGRMHQIRIHLAKSGAPIVGDDKHGNFKMNKLAKKALKIKKLLLCSKKLTIKENGKTTSFEVELPDYFTF